MAEPITFTTLEDALLYYSTADKAWTKEKINAAIAALGKVFSLKIRVDSIDDLPSPDDPDETKRPKVGDLYTVGAEDAAEFEEFYFGANGKWERMGRTTTDLSGYITAAQLYQGEDGTGTIAAPATGTLLASIYSKIGTDIETAKTELIGADTDTADADTIKGAKKFAAEKDSAMDTRVSALEAATTTTSTFITGLFAD